MQRRAHGDHVYRSHGRVLLCDRLSQKVYLPGRSTHPSRRLKGDRHSRGHRHRIWNIDHRPEAPLSIRRQEPTTDRITRRHEPELVNIARREDRKFTRQKHQCRLRPDGARGRTGREWLSSKCKLLNARRGHDGKRLLTFRDRRTSQGNLHLKDVVLLGTSRQFTLQTANPLHEPSGIPSTSRRDTDQQNRRRPEAGTPPPPNRR